MSVSDDVKRPRCSEVSVPVCDLTFDNHVSEA
jgi:hypothetical protein